MRNLRRAALSLTLALCLVLTGAVPATAAAGKIDKMLKGMSLSDKVGQMFLADCPEGARNSAKTYQLGGYVLFARDFENRTPADVKKAIKGYQSVSKIPMLITVDEEGGTVTRVSRYKAFRSSSVPVAAGGVQGGRRGCDPRGRPGEGEAAQGTGHQREPRAGRGRAHQHQVLHLRPLLRHRPQVLTGKYVAAVVKESKKAGLGAVLKHFPGYGDNGDTHTGIEVDSRPLSTFQEAGPPALQGGH